MTSILTEIKKTLNLGPTDTSFDTDVIMHINSVFSILSQVGIGPANGFSIVDDSATWETFLGGDTPIFNNVKSYMYLKVRLLFDPPQNSFTLASLEKLAQELEWRLNVTREGESWTDPTVPVPTP